MYASLNMRVFVRAFMCVCMIVEERADGQVVCMSAYVCVCMYVCVGVCTYVCMYVWVYVHVDGECLSCNRLCSTAFTSTPLEWKLHAHMH